MTKKIGSELKKLIPAYAVVFILSFFCSLLALVPPIFLLQVHERVYTSRSFITLGFLTTIAFLLIASLAVLLLSLIHI